MKNFQKMTAKLLILTVVLSVFTIGRVSASSSVATLEDIEVDGWGVYQFDPETTDYTVKIPYRYQKDPNNVLVPSVSVKTTDPGAQASISYPSNLPGTITINVTAEDGVTQKQYRLNAQPVGVNLFIDSGFENYPYIREPWFARNHGSTWEGARVITSSQGEVYSGDNAVYVPAKYAPISTADTYYQTIMNFDTNSTYINSFMVKAESPESMYVRHYLGGGGSGLTLVRPYGSGDYAPIVNGVPNEMWLTAKDSEWQRGTATFRYDSTVHATTNQSFAAISYEYGKSFFVDEHYMGKLVIGEVKISGEDTVTVPETDSTQIQLTAQVLNQFGEIKGLYEEQQISEWKIVGDAPGVSIDQTGLLTVDNTAQPGIVKIEAIRIPSYLGHEQEAMGGRFEIMLLPETIEKSISYSEDSIVNGDISATLLYTNDSKASMNVIFFTALYKNDNNKHVLCDIKAEEFNIDPCQTAEKTHTVTVPDNDDYIIRSFLWNDKCQPVLTVGALTSQ